MEKLVAIVGPTAVGKTKLSVELAKKYNGEIINGDAFQGYKKLDIGTAKIRKEEMCEVKHHLFDFLNPDDNFSVAEYQKLVREKISDINKRGKIPILVGGSGMYIQSVIYDYNFSEVTRNDDFTKQFNDLLNDELYLKLLKIDAISAEKIHPNNRKRVIRALEIAMSGNNKSELERKQKNEMLYQCLLIGLELERDKLYSRINKRVDDMVRLGLEQEVLNLYESIPIVSQSLQAIGYKEWFDFFKGEISKEEAIEKIKQNSRRYAKKQFTYFKNRMPIYWIETDIQKFNNTIDKASEIIKQTFI